MPIGHGDVAEHKAAIQGLEIKDADQGLVDVVFSRLNVIDADKDVTLDGAFEDGAKVRVSAYGHASWGPSRGASFVPMPPVGKGVIRVAGEEAIAETKFFLNTASGRDHFELVKEMGELQEWSYGYDVVESERGEFEGEKVRFLKRLKVHEISPVLLGAGVGTRTLAAKSADDDGEDGNEEGEEAARKSFPDEAERVLGDVQALVARVEGWGRSSDAKEGRVLSARNRERLSTLVTSIAEVQSAIDELLADTEPKQRDELLRERVRLERLRTQAITGGLT